MLMVKDRMIAAKVQIYLPHAWKSQFFHVEVTSVTYEFLCIFCMDCARKPQESCIIRAGIPVFFSQVPSSVHGKKEEKENGKKKNCSFAFTDCP